MQAVRFRDAHSRALGDVSQFGDRNNRFMSDRFDFALHRIGFDDSRGARLFIGSVGEITFKSSDLRTGFGKVPGLRSNDVFGDALVCQRNVALGVVVRVACQLDRR